MALKALVVLTASLTDRVGDAGDDPRVGMARVPFWAGDQVNSKKTVVPASPRQPTCDLWSVTRSWARSVG